jgi:hypothetical protein
MIEQCYNFSSLEECLRHYLVTEEKLDLWKEAHPGVCYKMTLQFHLPEGYSVKIKIILNEREEQD